MTLSSTQNSLCQQLTDKYNGLVGPVRQASTAFADTISSLTSLLGGMTFSAAIDINEHLALVADAIKDSIPGSDIDAMIEITDFIEQCDVLDTNPLTELQGMENSIFNKIDDLLTLDTTSAEFGASFAISGLTDQLGGDDTKKGNLSDLMAKADKLIDCLTSLCGPSYSTIASDMSSDLNNLYSAMGVDDDPNSADYGKLDTASIYANAGISPSDISNMNAITVGTTALKAVSNEKVNEAQAAAKDFLKAKSLPEVPRGLHGKILQYL